MTSLPKTTVQISDEKLAEMELIFEKFDVDGNHLPFSDELETMMRMLGFDPDWKELRSLQSRLRGLDLMEFNQFVKIIAEQEHKTGNKRGYEESEILDIFKRWDPNNTGFISKEQFIESMTTRGDGFEQDELEEMLREMQEVDEGGEADQIAYEPFIKKIFEDLAHAKELQKQEVEEFIKAKEKEKELEKKRREKSAEENTEGSKSKQVN
ncbi:calmodulin-2-like [Diaphorina citri]|uniref:Calmodulin-2-like n=1 Tax=Diaphorina citri TaxID=121845 RepID=A0A1S3D6V5_DIACI|nr:calmodulin-2-like [Diaphorina citri]KAI5750142.1 hypothetical protein M8J76_013167 [Diaphorina citri]KAI5754069.1 hypothetical protein M8J77_005477 [Diaphorina citri]